MWHLQFNIKLNLIIKNLRIRSYKIKVSGNFFSKYPSIIDLLNGFLIAKGLSGLWLILENLGEGDPIGFGTAIPEHPVDSRNLTFLCSEAGANSVFAYCFSDMLKNLEIKEEEDHDKWSRGYNENSNILWWSRDCGD